MLNDMTDESRYTGECPITRMVWNMGEESEPSTWGTMRAVIALAVEESPSNPFSEETIWLCARDLLEGSYPVFSVGTQLDVYVSSSTDDWDEFIRSWAEVYAHLGDVELADNADEMAQILKDNPYGIEAVEGEGVDEFNTRKWEREVDDVLDALTEDFDELNERLIVARTMYLAQWGEAAV